MKKIGFYRLEKIFSNSILIVIALVFFTSGIGKLLEPTLAVNALVMIPLSGINYNTAKVIIFILSNVEIALALLLLTKRFSAIAMRFIFGLLVCFLIFLIYVKANGIIVDDCGCFGGLIKRTIPEAIVDEIVLIGLWFIFLWINYIKETRLLTQILSR